MTVANWICLLQRTGVVYKRVEELENQIWKLEEERGNLKQDNASLVSFQTLTIMNRAIII